MTPDSLSDRLLAAAAIPVPCGVCAGCGRDGPLLPDTTPPVCEPCAYACRRYDEYRWAAERGLADTHYWPIHGEPPPAVRPVPKGWAG